MNNTFPDAAHISREQVEKMRRKAEQMIVDQQQLMAAHSVFLPPPGHPVGFTNPSPDPTIKLKERIRELECKNGQLTAFRLASEAESRLLWEVTLAAAKFIKQPSTPYRRQLNEALDELERRGLTAPE